MKLKTRILPLGLVTFCTGCCVGSGSYLEIKGSVDANARIVTLPVKQYKTEKQFNVHLLKCGDITASGVEPETVAYVDVPLQFCQKAKPLPDGWPGLRVDGSFVFYIAGKNETFGGSCSAYVHPRTKESNYNIFLRHHP